ncbi:MAG: hypothetical protein BGO98_24625 [Myxococcales bacterium 68-20]|nr:hypothetical protein [Myxococcales bacterium]OJY15854.1 MAG: hypothetical protein BGO98_24625 [Myxococcales bacterium 68-20]
MSSSDFEPLLRGSLDETARTLLESTKDDAPDPNARARMLSALAGAPASPDGGGRLSQLLRRSGHYLHGAGAVLVLSGAATLVVATSFDAPPARGQSDAPARSPADAAIAPPEPAPLGDGTASAIPIVTPHALPSAPVAQTNAGAKVAPPKRVKHATQAPLSPPESRVSTLSLEIAQVEATRAALAAGDATRTLALLDQYDREFPTGAFAVEVAVLRIEALARAGRTDEARRLGTRFLSEHRMGAFARRVTIALENANTHRAAPASNSDSE